MTTTPEFSESEVPQESAPDFMPVVTPPLPDDAPEWAHALNANVGALASGINQTNAYLSRALVLFDKISTEVTPAIESLKNTPIFKMLGVK